MLTAVKGGRTSKDTEREAQGRGTEINGSNGSAATCPITDPQ